MTGRPRRLPVLEFEVVGIAVGTAVVSGALSLLVPYLASLTGALAALAVAGWAARRAARAPSGPPPFLAAGEWLALGSVALGGVLFLRGPSPLPVFRGLLLGLALIPLWCVARTLPRSRS